jgi:hypothetical protein
MGFIKDTWNTLLQLRHATNQTQQGSRPIRIGSPPEATDDDISVLSSSYEYYKSWTTLEPDRLSIYGEMDEMMTYCLASSAMDAYVEDAVQPDFKSGKAVMFQSVNPEVKKILEQLSDNLELEDRVYGDLWHLGKYGDYFNLLLIDEEKGVFDACPLEPRIVWRHEDSRRVLRGFSVGDASENSTDAKLDIPKYKPWDVVHWRLRSRRIQDPYGSPFFFHARQIYKMLKLMEEQMVVYRMNMHPDRLVFKVFTGNAGPEERRRVVRQWRREMEHNTMIDRSTGMMRSEFAPWMINQSIYWPCFVRGTKVSLLDGTETPIEELVGRDSFWVYSSTEGGRVIPGRGHSARLTRKNSPVVKVTLDSGETIRCTSDHRFMLRDGTYKEAQHLLSGESLMPLYRKMSSKKDDHLLSNYEMVWDNAAGRWTYTHEAVTAGLGVVVPAGSVRHHRDLNKHNNTPENLDVMETREHFMLHSTLQKRRMQNPAFKAACIVGLDRIRKDPEYIQHMKSLRTNGVVGWSAVWKDADFRRRMSEQARAKEKGWGKCWSDAGFATKVSASTSASNTRRFSTEVGRTTAIDNLSRGRAKNWADPEYRRANSERTAERNFKRGKIYKSANDETKAYLLDEFKKARASGLASIPESVVLRNHKVVSVEPDGFEDVYDFTVDNYHNFALSAGVFVHNCGSGDTQGGVEKFQGSSNAGDVLDVSYMRDLFFASVRVPKAYMGLEDSQGYRGSETLSGQSVKFARGVKRLQKHYLQGIMRMAKIHLAVRGVDYREPGNAFAASMSPTSYLDEAQRAELYAKRFEALNVMLDIGTKMAAELGLNRPAWAEYVLKEFGGFDDETIMKFLAPSSATPDITLTPNDHSLTFEGQLRERVENDSKMSKAAVDLADSSGIIVREGSTQSTLDLPSRSDLVSSAGRDLYESGKVLSERATATYEREVTEKRRERTEVLRRVAQEWAAKNQE